MNEQAVAEGFETKKCVHEGFGCGTLEEGAGLRVDGRAEEIVGGGVANVEMNVGAQGCELDEVGLAELAVLVRRRSRQGFVAKLVYRARRSDLEDLALFGIEVPIENSDLIECVEDHSASVTPCRLVKVNSRRSVWRCEEREASVRRRPQSGFRAIHFAQD